VGYPVLFSHRDRAILIQAINAYIKCMRQQGRRVTQWPIQTATDGTYHATLDVCGSFDKSLDGRCGKFHNATHTHVDLREFSPGKKIYTRGVKK
jgi:hypothetical protein